MIDDRTMDDLRLAAALVHAVPDLGLALDADGPRLRVVPRAAEPAGHHPVPHLSPCAFRTAVAEAHALRRHGRAVALRGLTGHTRPTLRLEGRGQTQVLAGGITMFRCGGQERVAAATLLTPAACAAELGAEAGEPDTDLDDDLELRLHHDEALEVTILHAGGPELELDRAMLAVVTALARTAAAELLASISP